MSDMPTFAPNDWRSAFEPKPVPPDPEYDAQLAAADEALAAAERALQLAQAQMTSIVLLLQALNAVPVESTFFTGMIGKADAGLAQLEAYIPQLQAYQLGIQNWKLNAPVRHALRLQLGTLPTKPTEPTITL